MFRRAHSLRRSALFAGKSISKIMLAIFVAVIVIGLPDIVFGTIQTIKELF